MSERFARVAAMSDLPEGTLLGVVTPDGERICLVNDGGEIHALADECPHQGFAMSSGELIGGHEIECVWHGARFDCRTGAVLRGPADEALPRYAVRLDGGSILVGPKLP